MSDTSDTDLVDYDVGITVNHAAHPTQYIGRSGFLWTGSGITLEVARPTLPMRSIRVDSLDPQFWVCGWGEPIPKYEPAITTLDYHYQETVQYILAQHFEENITAQILAELISAIPTQRDLARRHIPGVTPDKTNGDTYEIITIRIPAWKASIITLSNLIF